MKLCVFLFACLVGGHALAQVSGEVCPPPLPQPTNAQWIEKAKIAKNAGLMWKVEKRDKCLGSTEQSTLIT